MTKILTQCLNMLIVCIIYIYLKKLNLDILWQNEQLCYGIYIYILFLNYLMVLK